MYQDELAKLSKDELMARVLAQTAQIEELTRRICRARSETGWATQDPGQLLGSAIAGTQAQPRRATRGEQAKGPSRGVPGAGLRSGPDRRERCRMLPALRARADPGRSGWLPRL